MDCTWIIHTFGPPLRAEISPSFHSPLHSNGTWQRIINRWAYGMHGDAVDRVEGEVVKGQCRGPVHVDVTRRHIVDQWGDGSALAKFLPVLCPVAAVRYGNAQVGSEMVVGCAYWE